MDAKKHTVLQDLTLMNLNANKKTYLVMMERNVQLILVMKPPELAKTLMLSLKDAQKMQNALLTTTATNTLSSTICQRNAKKLFVTKKLELANLDQDQKDASPKKNAKFPAKPPMLVKPLQPAKSLNLEIMFATESKDHAMTEKCAPMTTAITNLEIVLTNLLKVASANLNATLKVTVLNGQRLKIWLINASSHLVTSMLEAASPNQTHLKNVKNTENAKNLANQLMLAMNLNAPKVKENHTFADTTKNHAMITKNVQLIHAIQLKDAKTTIL